MNRNSSFPHIKESVPIPSGKENFKIAKYKEGAIPKILSSKPPSRNPLSDLGNIESAQIDKEDAKSKKVAKSRSLDNSKCIKSRSNSTSSLDKTNVQRLLNCKFVDNRSESKKVEDNLNPDEVFINGKEHLLNYSTSVEEKSVDKGIVENTAGKQELKDVLPIVGTLEKSDENTSQGNKKIARKSSLLKKRRSRVADIFTYCLYDIDYFNDNIHHMLDNEVEFIFRKSYLMKFIDGNSRYVCVSWIIYLQQLLEVTESALFMTVRLFDNVLIRAKVATDKYYLIGIVCFWISVKYVDTKIIMASKLFTLCRGKYSRNQITEMEKSILKLVDYKLNYTDPSSFLYYFLKMESLEGNLELYLMSMLLLEIYLLIPDHSSKAPSLLASSAFYLACEKLKYKPVHFLTFTHRNFMDNEEFIKFCHTIEGVSMEMLKCTTISGEIIKKYSSAQYLNVCKYFL